MKRILSILSAIAMVLTMTAMIALPAAAETADGKLVNLFDFDTALKGTVSGGSTSNYYSTDYIEVAPGDTLYFGVNDVDLGYQLYVYADTSGSSSKKVSSEECTVEETVAMPNTTYTWGILSYTVPEGYTQARVTCRTHYAKQYLLTRNQPFTNAERLQYFGLVDNIYDKSAATKGYYKANGTITGSGHYSSEKIPVLAGDKLYFGPCNSTQNFQLYHWDANGTSTRGDHTSVPLEITEIFEGGQVIYCYTVAEDGKVGITNAAAYNDFFVITKNEQLTVENYFAYWDAQISGPDLSAVTTAPAITANSFKAATQGYYQADGTIKTSSTIHYSGGLIEVAAGDVIYFGPVNMDQGFHLYDWHGSDATDFSDYTRINKAEVQAGTRIHTVATFPNGQGILAYEVIEDGRVGLVNATAYNDFFLATKNVRMTVENYYAYYDLTDNRGLKYSATLGRYNDYKTVESVLNGKTALFTGDSICIGHGDDDYYNDQNLGGWAGRIAQYYDLERATNNGVSGAALSTTRDRWYNAPASTAKQQGRIYWQITKEADYQYDYVILHGGVNDAWDTAPIGTVSDSKELEDFDLSTYAGGLEATIYYATKYHPEAAIGYVMNFYAPNCTSGVVSDMGGYFEVGKQICEKWGIPCLDLYNTLDFDTTVYTYDKIHPNAAGYDILYTPIAKWMETLEPYSEHTVQEHDKTVIACVGDSLTKGEQSGDINRYSYPAYLQEMLGDQYDVLNLGWGGAAAQTTASNTYKATVQYKQGLEADPDAVVIMLGANDAKTANWDTADHAASRAAFKADLKALAEEYKSLTSQPTVYLATPTYSSEATRIEIYNNGGMLTAISEIAAELEIELIDTYTPTEGQTALLSDGTHFTAAGYELLAGEIYKAVMDADAAPDVLSIDEKDTAVAETDETKPLVRNWKAYYETVDAFRIETVEDVEIFGDLIAAGYTFAGKTVYLMNDLDFTGIDFTPLGASTGKSDTPTETEYARAFQGTFDGQNHVFSNVNISSMWYQVGLFTVTSGAVIKNFGLDGGRVEGFDYIGSIVGLGCESTSLYNVWSSADVHAAYRAATITSGIIGYLRKGSAETYPELINIAYYGTLSSTNRIGGICGNSGTSTVVKDIVFGGTLDLRSKHGTVTPLIRYSSTTSTITGAASGFYIAEGTEVRTTYLADVVPVAFSADAFGSGEFAYYMNNLEGSTAKWIVRDGYTVPWGDENTAIRKIKISGEVVYTAPDSTIPESILSTGSYWYYTDGKCYTAATAANWILNDGDSIALGISAAGADYDNDGSFTVGDATLLLKYIDGANTTLDAAMADVNANGKVNAFDAVLLLNVINDLVVE